MYSHFRIGPQISSEYATKVRSPSENWGHDNKSVNPGHWKLAKGGLMLYWAVVFLVIAIIAAVFGFGGIAVAATGIAKLLFFIFLVLFVVSLIFHLGRAGRGV